MEITFIESYEGAFMCSATWILMGIFLAQLSPYIYSNILVLFSSKEIFYKAIFITFIAIKILKDKYFVLSSFLVLLNCTMFKNMKFYALIHENDTQVLKLPFIINLIYYLMLFHCRTLYCMYKLQNSRQTMVQ